MDAFSHTPSEQTSLFLHFCWSWALHLLSCPQQGTDGANAKFLISMERLRRICLTFATASPRWCDFQVWLRVIYTL